MSQYLNIHLRDKDGKFHYLTSYSRSTPFYQVAHAPYEKVRKFTCEDFDEMERELEIWNKNCDVTIKDRQDTIDFLKGCNRPMDEVMEQYHDYRISIKELKQEKKDTESWISTIRVFGNIADDIESDCEIYMGVEISEPTETDIVS